MTPPTGLVRKPRPGVPSVAQVAAAADRLADMYVKVGIPYNKDALKKYYSDAPLNQTVAEDPDLTLVEVATFNEFGTEDGHTPPRPFMHLAFEGGKAEIKKLVAKGWVRVLRGERQAEDIPELVGQLHQGQVQQVIAEGVDPPNAPFTVFMKGSSRTLINQGQLRQSITYVVVEGDPGRSEVRG